MLVGFGCSVPAIMATRTLSSERDRRMTILLTPFMSCSAKLPIYAMLVRRPSSRGRTGRWSWSACMSLGSCAAFCMRCILKLTTFRGEPVPFVMELPNYRLPSAKSVGHLIWEKAKGFLQQSIYRHLPGLHHHLVPADV